jgi:thiol-disulfide isomerase/thioredoxin
MKKMILASLALAAAAVLQPGTASAYEVGDAAACVVLTQSTPTGDVEGCIREKTLPTQTHTLIEFFSVTCSDCAKNLPKVSALAQELGSSLQVRLVSIDKKEGDVRDYIAAHKAQIDFPVAFDLDRDAKKAYSVVATPTIYVLDADYDVVFKKVGVLSPSDIATIKSIAGN